jgi:NitT/TauT family transport system ATP-binding protein
MANQTQVLVQLEHVTQSYGKQKFVAVHDVNLTLTEGEFVVLLGPSGCGKSTLLRIITGLQSPTEGRVLYRGQQLIGVNPQAAIVFQTFALFPWLTVQENVEIALKARGVPEAERAKRALPLLDKVGLDGFETAYPRELSGGMRQKVGFARAMAVEPELLCLDEPFSALDVLSAESLRGELLELWQHGDIPTKLILMVTHNIEEAILLADRIVLMDKGPGRVVGDFKVPLPRPRLRKDPAFIDVVDKVYATLAGQTQPEHIELGTAPGEPGSTRSLPHVNINELTGLLEHLDEIPGDKTDIYKLASELGLDSDHLLQLTEFAELLSFANVAHGDISLTPLGQTFAEAGILARKGILAARIKRLPLFKWLLRLLNAANDRRLEWDVALAALSLEFPPDEAERQMETVINLGRYAELFAYDDDEEVLYLEQEPTPAP